MKRFISYFGFLQLFYCTAVFAQGYCIPSISGNIIMIHNFAFHTLENFSSGVSAGNYIYYPDSVFTTQVNMGETYPISISNDITAGIYGRFFAWIDYNNDSIFDPSEEVYNDTVSFHSAWGFVTIPNNTNYLGKRRMRIINYWTSGVVTPCIVGSGYGESEDYEITITTNAPHIPTYCHAFNYGNMDNYIIDDFQLNTLSNINSGSDSDNYVFYPDTVFTTTLIMGNNYNVHISKDVLAGNTGGQALWMDLDNDGDFSSAEMLVSAGPGIYQYTGIINIPVNSLYAGQRRVRIRSQWVGITGPYGIASGSETEDYLVTITMPTGFNNPGTVNNKFYQLYPNPVTDHINFISLKNDGQPVNVIICTKEGKQVYQNNFFHLKSSIDVSGLAAGIYSITVFNDSFTQTSKFVKL